MSTGIQVEDSNDFKVEDNNVEGVDKGIHISSSTDFTTEKNNIIENQDINDNLNSSWIYSSIFYEIMIGIIVTIVIAIMIKFWKKIISIFYPAKKNKFDKGHEK